MALKVFFGLHRAWLGTLSQWTVHGLLVSGNDSLLGRPMGTGKKLLVGPIQILLHARETEESA